MTVGENIKKFRKKAHLTQRALAKEVGLATITIQQYERGVREPRLDIIFKIAKVLGVLPTVLIEDMSEELALYIENHTTTYDKDIIIATTDETKSDPLYEHAKKEICHFLKLLNEDGQEVAIERIKELTEIPKYQRNSNNSDSFKGHDLEMHIE